MRKSLSSIIQPKGYLERAPNMAGDYSRFDAVSFLRTRYSSPEAERSQFYLRCFHEFYQKYHTQWDATRTRLLEYGGGPAIAPLISAAPFVSEIVFAEYAESNRKEVVLWKENNPDAYDWSPHFNYVVNKLEGNVDSEAAKVRERILRDRISRVIPCDIKADEKSLLGGEEIQEQFDIISQNGCIESAVNSTSEFQKCLAKLKTLLKPSGLLVGVQFLGASWYEVQGENYHNLSLTEEVVVTAFQQAGFTILEKQNTSTTVIDAVGHTVSGAKGLMFVVAKAT